METEPRTDSIARQAERLAGRIDALAIHRSKREEAKAELFAAFALLEAVVAMVEALRDVIAPALADRADAGLGDIEREARP